MSSLAIIILNWNGWKDTCECLSSIMLNSYTNYHILLIDNGSSDHSVDRIRQWAAGKMQIIPGPFHSEKMQYSVPLKELSSRQIKSVNYNKADVLKHKLILIKNPDNIGFSAGANIGIQHALDLGLNYIFLLNNDTTISPDCLSQIMSTIKENAKIRVLTPLILYYNEPHIIWYFGGKLTFTGRRAIYYQNRRLNKLRPLKPKRVTFVSGCALFVDAHIFRDFGLLTERFFFGEEDYEFSLRMKKYKIPIHATPGAVVYHKVGRSNRKFFDSDRLPYMFIGFLNRFINKKNHTRFIQYWYILRLICMSYIIPKLIVMHKYSFAQIKSFTVLLMEYSSNMTSVDKNTLIKAKQIL